MKARSLGVPRLAAVWLLLLGCAPMAQVPTPAPPEARLVQLEAIQSAANGSKQPPKVLPLDAPETGLRAGEDYALTVELNAPGHLYLVRSGASGATRLYPAMTAKDATQPAGKVRVPGSEGWLRVASLDSTDLLCVVTSQAVLAPADLSCQTAPDGARGDDHPPPQPDPAPVTTREPPPPPKDTRHPDYLRVLLLPIHRTP